MLLLALGLSLGLRALSVGTNGMECNYSLGCWEKTSGSFSDAVDAKANGQIRSVLLFHSHSLSLSLSVPLSPNKVVEQQHFESDVKRGLGLSSWRSLRANAQGHQLSLALFAKSLQWCSPHNKIRIYWVYSNLCKQNLCMKFCLQNSLHIVDTQ